GAVLDAAPVYKLGKGAGRNHLGVLGVAVVELRPAHLAEPHFNRGGSVLSDSLDDVDLVEDSPVLDLVDPECEGCVVVQVHDRPAQVADGHGRTRGWVSHA